MPTEVLKLSKILSKPFENDVKPDTENELRKQEKYSLAAEN